MRIRKGKLYLLYQYKLGKMQFLKFNCRIFCIKSCLLWPSFKSNLFWFWKGIEYPELILCAFFRFLQASDKLLYGEISMHGIFQALAAVWLRPLPYFCVTSSKTEGLPGGIIWRNTPTGFEVYLFCYVYWL